MSEGQPPQPTAETAETESAAAETGADRDEPAPVTTGAQSVVRALERAGVEHLFGVQGGAIMPVYDALYDADMTHITMAHEQGAAHAADAFGIVSGEPGVCLATSGPGATNLVTGIADASMDSDPMIALTGPGPIRHGRFGRLPGDGHDGRDRTHHEGELLRQLGGFYRRHGGRGVRARRCGPAGPDPRRPPEGRHDWADGDRSPATVGRPTPTTHPSAPTKARSTEAAGVLARAEKPVILAGGGVIKGEASTDCSEFATEYGIPVVTTMPAIGAFPEDHDLALEMAGMHGTGYANMAITHCDVLFAIGTRFDDRLTGGVDTFAPEAQVIHADIDAAEISKNIHADHPLLGDAGTVIEQVGEALADERAADMAATGERFGEWREQCQGWKEDYPMDYAAPEDAPMKPQFVVEAVDAATPDDTIVTTGVGQHQMWACQYWTYTQPRTWVSSHGLGTMGYGLPAAIGAKVAADDDQSVVCFDGDGSFLMTLQELAVAVRENLDITVVRSQQRGHRDGASVAGRLLRRAGGWPPSTRGCPTSPRSPRRSARAASDGHVRRGRGHHRGGARLRRPLGGRLPTSTPTRTSTRWSRAAGRTVDSFWRRSNYEGRSSGTRARGAPAPHGAA